jgi:hypothetical protein
MKVDISTYQSFAASGKSLHHREDAEPGTGIRMSWNGGFGEP